MLTWDANTEADFLRYRIYGSEVSHPNSAIDSADGVSNTSKIITGLTNGTRYYFRITALDSSLNESGFSNEVSATPRAGNPSPAAPQNLQATPGLRSVTLTWAVNNEADFLRYRIYGGTAPVPTTQIDSVAGADHTSRTIAGLTAGTTYFFRLTAVDSALQESAYSATVSAVPLADTEAPAIGRVNHASSAPLNTAIPISVSIHDTSGVKTAELHFRPAGAASYFVQPMERRAGGMYTREISAAAVTNRGVEFFIQAEDSAGNVSRTQRLPIRVVCPDGVLNPAVQPSGTDVASYRLFSIPLDLDEASPGAFLAANPLLAQAEATRYRWYAFDRGTQTLREYPDFAGISITPDMGFALLVDMANVQLRSGSGKTVITTEPYRISLPAGWSLIGNPFNYSIPFDSLSASSGTFELWDFDGDWRLNTRGLEPWKGYAIWLSEAAVFSIRPGAAGLGAISPRYSPEQLHQEDWLVRISASDGESISEFNLIGQISQASDGIDSFDLHSPMQLGEQIALFFIDAQANKTRNYLKADIRQPSPKGHIWSFFCETGPRAGALSLSFAGIENVPAHFNIFLIDEASQLAYNLRANARLEFAVKGRTIKQFKLLVGTSRFLDENEAILQKAPKKFALLQNYPNPFNPSTQIVYSLGKSEEILLQVFNLQGQEIATLFRGRQSAGVHTAVWHAENTGSGIYFIELRARGIVLRKKCMIVK